jgi:predicted nucleotidyltransferase component of viral defense system
MSEVTTIQLDKKIVRELKDVKEYPEQTYSALLQKLIALFKRVKERDQYDKFLHTIQQQKMRELWDNKADEAWENA